MGEWDHGRRQGPFRLNAGTAIIVYTGAAPWNSPQTLSELIDAPQPLVMRSPAWNPIVWETRKHSAAELLGMEQPLFQSLAVVRGQNEPPDEFQAIFAETSERLRPLRRLNPGRWTELMRFALSWSLSKRNPAEHERLRLMTRKVYRSHQAREEIDRMAESILEAEYLRGARKGLEQGFAQGETRGRMLAQREALIGLLRKKFGSSADEAAIERIAAAEDLELLGEWLEAAGLARSWKQFARAANWTHPS